MPQCQFPIFYCFCVSEMLYRKYSRNWTKQKLEVQIFKGASRRPKRRRRGATGRPHHRAARPRAGPRPLVVRPPWSTSDAAPSPIKTSRREKPKTRSLFQKHIAIHRRRRPEIGRVQKLFPALQQGLRLRHLLTRLQPVATRNLHTTQPNTLLPTYDKVVNLTGLL
jgi:hypothetical protein